MYSVAFAEKRLVGDEWNHVKWNKHHYQIQYHRLYLPVNGRASISLYDRTLELIPGNIYFIPAFSVLESAIEGEMDKYYIHFQSSHPILSLYRYFSDKYSIAADAMSEGLFRTVVENYAEPTLGARFKVQGAMNILLSEFMSDIAEDSPGLSRFEEVLLYIDENFTKNISLSELASMMNMSTMYFSNSFKRTFRISPKQYILNKRLAESQRLLLESKMSIKEIAYAVGFDNENYFSEFFSAKVGISALKFRNREIPRTRDSIL